MNSNCPISSLDTDIQAEKTTDSAKEIDLEQLLRDGYTIRIKPQGTSMHPLFVSGRDEAYIAPASPTSLRRGDVALYRRQSGILVLHRIWRIRSSGFYMVGDNQTEIEGPLSPDQMKGFLTGFVRKGHYTSVKNPIYRSLSAFWLAFRPLRPVVWKFTALLRTLFRRG